MCLHFGVGFARQNVEKSSLERAPIELCKCSDSLLCGAVFNVRYADGLLVLLYQLYFLDDSIFAEQIFQVHFIHCI